MRLRVGPKVERRRCGTLQDALDLIEERGRQVAGQAQGRPIDLKVRRFEPVQQVAARLEVSGPKRLWAGVDVRGDGSTEGYVGRLRRRVVDQHGGESAYDALRRVLDSAR